MGLGSGFLLESITPQAIKPASNDPMARQANRAILAREKLLVFAGAGATLAAELFDPRGMALEL